MNHKLFWTLVGTLALVAGSAFAQNNASTGNQQAVGPLVKLSLIVTDGNAHSIDEIRKEDLKVVEVKTEQAITHLEPDNRPIDYGLVIDSSGSFRKSLPLALGAAKLIVKSNRLSDETFIERFVSSYAIETAQEFTRDTTQLLDALDSFKIGSGPSAVLDAVYMGADHVAKRNPRSPERRRALVLISDGEDRNSYYTLDATVRFLRDAEVQVFIIGMVADLDKDAGFIRESPRALAESLLKRLAQETGGRLFLPKNNSELLSAANEIIHDLHGQFVIEYQSTNVAGKKGFRKVEVYVTKAGGEKLKAITPLGYFVDAPGSPPKP